MAKLKISLCEFQDGTFELYVIDSETGEEVQINGKQSFSDRDRAILERLMPPCVFTDYEQTPPKPRFTSDHLK